MKNSHVAIFTIPAPVHVNPTIPVVSVLIRRGFRVTYVTSQRHAEELAMLGAEVLRCPRFESPLDQHDGDASKPIDQQYATTLTDLASRTLEIVWDFYRSERPDVVVFDTHSYAGLLLSERLGVPSIRVTSHLLIDEDATFNHATLDAFFRENGVARGNPLMNRDGRTVHLFSQQLQIGHKEPDSAHFYAPRCAAERLYGHSPPPYVRHRDSALVSCSTFYVQGRQYYSMCMEVLSQLRFRATLSIGIQTDVESLGPIQSGCKIERGVPLLALMPSANVLVFQGGMATTMEALYHGLPMVVLTQGHAQLETYADNIQDHRLGIHLRREQTNVESIKRCILHVIEDAEIQRSVRAMQSLVKQSPGAEEVANLVECTLSEARS